MNRDDPSPCCPAVLGIWRVSMSYDYLESLAKAKFGDGYAEYLLELDRFFEEPDGKYHQFKSGAQVDANIT